MGRKINVAAALGLARWKNRKKNTAIINRKIGERKNGEKKIRKEGKKKTDKENRKKVKEKKKQEKKIKRKKTEKKKETDQTFTGILMYFLIRYRIDIDIGTLPI